MEEEEEDEGPSTSTRACEGVEGVEGRGISTVSRLIFCFVGVEEEEEVEERVEAGGSLISRAP